MKGVKKIIFMRNMTSLYAKEYIQCSQATFFLSVTPHTTKSNKREKEEKKGSTRRR